jgi:hypothetical protein
MGSFDLAVQGVTLSSRQLHMSSFDLAVLAAGRHVQQIR